MAQQLPAFDIENLVKVIELFFGQNQSQLGKDEMNKANQYLVDLEKSKQAWGLCGQVLMNCSQYSKTVVFHCAKVIKSKLQYDAGQLSGEEMKEFSKTIIQIIIQLSQCEMDRSIRSQFSIILIYIYFHTYQTWPDFIQFLQQTFYQNVAQHSFLYSIYEEMPEEVNNEKIVIDEQIRQNLLKHLKQDFQFRVIQELKTLFQEQGDIKYQYYGLKCMRNWLEFSYKKELWDSIESHPLFELALRSTECSELQEKSCDVIVAVLREIKEPQTHQNLFLKIAKSVFGFIPKCKDAIQQDLPDEIEIYMKIFKHFGKKAMKEFIINPDLAAQQFIEMIVILSDLEDMDNCEDIASFWKRFFKELGSLPEQQKQSSLQIYENVIRSVVKICVKRITLSEEHFTLFNKYKSSKIEQQSEDFETKNRTRISMKEVIQFSINCISPSILLTIIENDILIQHIKKYEQLKQAQQQQQQQQENIEIVKSLCTIEACLSAIHQCAEYHQSKYLGEFKPIVIKLMTVIIGSLSNETHVKLQKTAIKYFIDFPQFLEGNPEFQHKAFQYLLQTMTKKYLEQRSSNALERLIITNKQFVKANLQDFFQLMDNFKQNDEIVAGLSVVVGSEDTLIEQNLVSLCLPYVKQLKQCIDQSYKLEEGETLQNIVLDSLDKLTLIIENMPVRDSGFPHSLIQQIYVEVWPLLEYIMNNEKLEKVIEKVIRFVKYIMRNLKHDFAPYMKDLLNCGLQNFQKNPISPYLYLLEVTVTVFNQDSSYTEYLASILEGIFNYCVQFFKSYDSFLTGFEEEPYMCEDFFGMMKRIINYAPDVMLHVNKFQEIIQIVKAAHLLQNTKAAETMFSLIERLYIIFFPQKFAEIPEQKVPYYQNLRNILLENSQELMEKLMQALVEYPPESVSEYISDTILSMIKSFPEAAQLWFINSSRNVFNIDIITENERIKFVESFAYINNDQHQAEDQAIDFLRLVVERCQRSYMRQQNN